MILPLSLTQHFLTQFKTARKKLSFAPVFVLLSAITPMRRLEVLLADDDNDSCEIFTEAVNMIMPAAQVTCMSNGKKLMEALHNKHTRVPDLLFLDLNMPVKTGQECLTEIRSTNRLKNIPVIIYSNSFVKEDVEQSYSGGANFYMAKPDSFSELKNIIKHVLAVDIEMSPARKHFVLNKSISK